MQSVDSDGMMNRQTQTQGVQFLFFEPIPIFSYFLTKTSYFSYFLAGEAKICNKIETGMFSCMCP